MHKTIVQYLNLLYYRMLIYKCNLTFTNKSAISNYGLCQCSRVNLLIRGFNLLSRKNSLKPASDKPKYCRLTTLPVLKTLLY